MIIPLHLWRVDILLCRLFGAHNRKGNRINKGNLILCLVWMGNSIKLLGTRLVFSKLRKGIWLLFAHLTSSPYSPPGHCCCHLLFPVIAPSPLPVLYHHQFITKFEIPKWHVDGRNERKKIYNCKNSSSSFFRLDPCSKKEKEWKWTKRGIHVKGNNLWIMKLREFSTWIKRVERVNKRHKNEGLQL